MKYTTLALVAAFALTSVPVHAQLLDADMSTGIIAPQGDASATVRIEAGETATSGEEQSVDGPLFDADASGDSMLELSVMRGSMSEDTNYGVTESHEVRSAAGLESYAAASVRADERLDSVAIADSQMRMTYRKEARFLGFVPGSVRTDVSVDADGQVTVDYPWYAFLFAKGESEDELAARIQADVMAFSGASDDAGAMTATTTASASTGIQTGSDDVRYWAQVIDSVHAALSAEANVSAQASS